MLVRTGLTLDPGEYVDGIESFVIYIFENDTQLATLDIRDGTQITLRRTIDGGALGSYFSNDLEIISNVLLTMQEVLGGHPITIDDFLDMEEVPLYRLVS